MEAARNAIEQNLKVLEKQLEATPHDPVLYCDYFLVYVHKKILLHMGIYLTVHQHALDEMEFYFRMRIKASSSISKAEYEKDRAEINETLLDLYEQQRQTYALDQNREQVLGDGEPEQLSLPEIRPSGTSGVCTPPKSHSKSLDVPLKLLATADGRLPIPRHPAPPDH